VLVHCGYGTGTENRFSVTFMCRTGTIISSTHNQGSTILHINRTRNLSPLYNEFLETTTKLISRLELGRYDFMPLTLDITTDAYIVTHYPKISKYFGLYLDHVFHVFFLSV